MMTSYVLPEYGESFFPVSVHSDNFFSRFVEINFELLLIQGFDAQTDIHQLAEEIVAKCSLVNPVRLPEIEQLLHYLQNRRILLYSK